MKWWFICMKGLKLWIGSITFWGFMMFNSIKQPLRSSFHHPCNFSLGMLEMPEQQWIVDPKGHLSKSFCNISLMNSWAPCLNFFTPSHNTVSDWTNFLIAPLTAKPPFILFRGNKLSWSDKSILINFFCALAWLDYWRPYNDFWETCDNRFQFKEKEWYHGFVCLKFL